MALAVPSSWVICILDDTPRRPKFLEDLGHLPHRCVCVCVCEREGEMVLFKIPQIFNLSLCIEG